MKRLKNLHDCRLHKARAALAGTGKEDKIVSRRRSLLGPLNTPPYPLIAPLSLPHSKQLRLS